MQPRDENPFRLEEIEAPRNGLRAYRVQFQRSFTPDRYTPPDECARGTVSPEPRAAIGRAIVLDPTKFDLRIYPFYELIHRTWRPGTENFVHFGPNLGTSIEDFIKSGGPELRMAEDLRAERLLTRERAERMRAEYTRCVFACNSLQTNFVRGNGFVIASRPPSEDHWPELICRPCGSPGMYDDHYEALGPTGIANKDGSATLFDGRYDVIILECKQRGPCVGSFAVEDNKWQDPPMPRLAICSPKVLVDGRPRSAWEIPYCDNKDRQTIGNEVNWDPAVTCTSFTAFGVRADAKIVVVSMFEGAHVGDAASNRGILATEMGWLMSREPELCATDGVIGGGAADTQQFLHADRGDLPPLMRAPERAKRPGEVATPEVEGPRGLGAIFAVLQK